MAVMDLSIANELRHVYVAVNAKLILKIPALT